MTFETETHGRYEIKSGPLKGEWAANAYRHKSLVAKAVGSSREDAVESVKAGLARIEAIELSERDEEGAPSAKEYERAFLEILPRVSAGYIAMLRAHLAAPDQLISATKLAAAAGYEGYEGANLHYGKLGCLLAEEIGFSPPTRADGTEIWTCSIARDPGLDTDFPETTFVDGLLRQMETGHFEWQMRPQVVQALRALGF